MNHRSFWTGPVDRHLRMPWPAICETACQALILGISFTDVVEIALRQPLDWDSPRKK